MASNLPTPREGEQGGELTPPCCTLRVGRFTVPGPHWRPATGLAVAFGPCYRDRNTVDADGGVKTEPTDRDVETVLRAVRQLEVSAIVLPTLVGEDPRRPELSPVG